VTKRLLALVSIAVAAGTVLLTACGQGASSTAAPAASTSASTASATSTSTSGAPTSTLSMAAGKRPTSAASSHAGQPTVDANGVRPVNCGSMQDGSGRTVSLIADATPAGLVGCTEAFNVVDQYLKNAAKAQGSSRSLDLGNGWSCSTDGGSGPDQQGIISCASGKDDGHGGKTGGMALHTQPS
jgi:hypothetical protein